MIEHPTITCPIYLHPNCYGARTKAHNCRHDAADSESSDSLGLLSNLKNGSKGGKEDVKSNVWKSSCKPLSRVKGKSCYSYFYYCLADVTVSGTLKVYSTETIIRNK